MRAFLAGRLDLMQAEAVLGVIDAADQRQLHIALTQLAGGLSIPLQALRDDLLNLLADLEAGLDFVEDDIRFVHPDELVDRLSSAAGQLQRLATQLQARRTENEMPRVALIGSANVGKSSLFNALKGDTAAIVSPIAGTTRDYLIVQIDAAGMPIDLVDTAGILQTRSGDAVLVDRVSCHATDRINSSAIEIAVQQHKQADLCLLCLDSTAHQANGNAGCLTQNLPSLRSQSAMRRLINERPSLPPFVRVPIPESGWIACVWRFATRWNRNGPALSLSAPLPDASKRIWTEPSARWQVEHYLLDRRRVKNWLPPRSGRHF